MSGKRGKNRGPTYETEKKPFPKNLSSLMSSRKITQEALASAIGVKRQTISLYKTGQSTPDIEQLEKIARYFEVTTDWLLGLSDSKSLDKNIQIAEKTTGLHEKAIESLQEINEDLPYTMDTLGRMITSTFFPDFIENLYHYTLLRFANQKYDQSNIRRYIKEDQERAVKAIENSTSLSEADIIFLAIKSNIDTDDIASMYLNKARDYFYEIVKELGNFHN